MPFIKTIAIQKVKSGGSSAPPLPASPERNVGAGVGYSIFLNSLGRAWGWGNNTAGQVGNNSLSEKVTPVSVLGNAKTFLKISVGHNHTIALDKNGRAWGWGSANLGQLGVVTGNCALTPVSVGGAVKTFYEVTAGGSHSLAIDGTGKVWAWGNNQFGQLGDNSITQKNTPVSVAGAVKTFCKIVAGESHTLAIDKNGGVWAWGAGASGRLGDNQNVTSRLTPVSILGAVKTFCKISAGGATSHGIDKNGRLWGWGSSANGQLGDNSNVSKLTPVSILGLVKTFCEISTGYIHTLALDKNGRAWGWGYNAFGLIGDNSTTQRLTPVSVAGATKTFCKISAGKDTSGAGHSLAIDKNGGVWAWGYPSTGKLGNSTSLCRYSPTSVLGTVRTFSFVSAGQSHTMAIDNNGRVWGWGTRGNIAVNESAGCSYTPVSILGAVKTFCQIAASAFHTLAIDKNGRAWGWGANGGSGRIGDNTTIARHTPVSVAGVAKTFCRIAVGNVGAHSLAIDRYGRAWAWGFRGNGRLGDNQVLTDRCTPVSVLGTVKTFCQIAAGNTHSLAIDRYGRAWAWGAGQSGRLGTNSTVSALTPVSVCGAVKTFCQISGGSGHSVGLDKNGGVWTWGLNSSGQLGTGNITSRMTPFAIAGATKTFCQISAGFVHTLAIDKNGRVWGWGLNSAGAIGDGTNVDRCTPTAIAGVTKTFCRITAANNFSLAIDKNGRAWAWGSDDSGQLGLNTFNALTPVRVCVL